MNLTIKNSKTSKKIYRDAEECATIITKALNQLPVYYRYHIQKK
jgi:hypothetical protein